MNNLPTSQSELDKNHDPMCPRIQFQGDIEFELLDAEHYCSCALIAMVRQDEQHKRPASLDWIEGYQQGVRDATSTLLAKEEKD